jgi:hypothetical protein
VEARLNVRAAGLANFYWRKGQPRAFPFSPSTNAQKCNRQLPRTIIRAAANKSVLCSKFSRRLWPAMHLARSGGNGSELAEGIQRSPRHRVALPSTLRLALQRIHHKVLSSNDLFFFSLTTFSYCCTLS